MAIFGEGEVDVLAQFGSYSGWRLGITETGDWRFSSPATAAKANTIVWL